MRVICYALALLKALFSRLLDVKLSILSELAKLLKISVTDGYKGMSFQQITQ